MDKQEIIGSLVRNCQIGFRYKFEHISADGKVLSTEYVDNIMPDEGRDYFMNAGLNAGQQFSSWFIGLYEGNHTPVADDDAATFPATATEITSAYSETTRVPLVNDALDAGLWSNAGSPAEFTFTAGKTVRGGFISSASAKGGVTGVLLSAVLATTAKTVAAGETLRVTAGISLITA